MNQPEPIMTVYAQPCELPAVDAAVVSYLSLIEATVPDTAVRAHVMSKLRSLQQRYQALLQPTHNSRQPANLIPLRVTAYELMAFGTAVLGYRRMLEVAVPPEEYMEVMAHLHRFQQRYVDALPSSSTLHD